VALHLISLANLEFDSFQLVSDRHPAAFVRASVESGCFVPREAALMDQIAGKQFLIYGLFPFFWIFADYSDWALWA
jgi:hypothetical protein